MTVMDVTKPITTPAAGGGGRGRRRPSLNEVLHKIMDETFCTIQEARHLYETVDRAVKYLRKGRGARYGVSAGDLGRCSGPLLIVLPGSAANKLANGAHDQLNRLLLEDGERAIHLAVVQQPSGQDTYVIQLKLAAAA